MSDNKTDGTDRSGSPEQMLQTTSNGVLKTPLLKLKALENEGLDESCHTVRNAANRRTERKNSTTASAHSPCTLHSVRSAKNELHTQRSEAYLRSKNTGIGRRRYGQFPRGRRKQGQYRGRLSGLRRGRGWRDIDRQRGGYSVGLSRLWPVQSDVVLRLVGRLFSRRQSRTPRTLHTGTDRTSENGGNAE